jgi:hypothetical protein
MFWLLTRFHLIAPHSLHRPDLKGAELKTASYWTQNDAKLECVLFIVAAILQQYNSECCKAESTCELHFLGHMFLADPFYMQLYSHG